MRKRHRMATTVLTIIFIFMAYNIHSPNIVISKSNIFIRKNISYSYTFDITGKVFSSRIKVNIVLKCISEYHNLTIIDREYFMRPESIRIEKGPKPIKILKEGNLTKIIWNIKKIKDDIIVFRYSADTDRMPPIIFNVSISGKALKIDLENNIIKNVEKGRNINVKLYVKNNSTILQRHKNATYGFPYPTNIIITFPYKMLELIDYNIKPNLTSTQEDQKIVYWNIILDKDISINASFLISQLGVWKSIWIPPINIQLSEDPYMIISLIKRSKIEEMYNETLKSYKELNDMYKILNSTTSNITKIISLLREIGTLQLKAASKLSKGLDMIEDIMTYIEKNQPVEKIYSGIGHAETLLNETLNILGQLQNKLQEYNITQESEIGSQVEHVKSSIEDVYNILNNIPSKNKIQSFLDNTMRMVQNMSLGVKYMREAGLKQLELANIIEEKYYSNLTEYKDMLEDKLLKVNKTLDELEKIYDKYMSYKYLAYRLISFLNNSIDVYQDGRRLDAKKDFEVKDIVDIKMPMLVSNLPKIEIKTREEDSERSNLYFYLLGLGVLVVLLAFRPFRKRKKIVVEKVIEEKEIEDMIKEIRDILKKD